MTTRMKTLLMLGVLGVALALPAMAQRPLPCADSEYNNFNGPKSLFINLQNCGTLCAFQALPYLRLIGSGLTGVRIAPVPRDNTAAPDPDYYQVNDFDPYFTGVLEIFGPDNVLVLIDDLVDEGRFAKPKPNDMLRMLSSLLTRNPEVRHIEFMNEPLNFSNIRPEEYVARYLRPARALVDKYNADRAADNQIVLYSAAWFGNEDGVRQTRRMVRAGGLAFADVMAVHIYDRLQKNAEKRAREYRRLARGKPIAVTESNFNSSNRSEYEAQLWWVCQSMSSIEQILRRDMPASTHGLQRNVLYTLLGDEARFFNLIRFPDARRTDFWTNTGPGHYLLRDRSLVPTDPKQ